jgi:hypothetical protein
MDLLVLYATGCPHNRQQPSSKLEAYTINAANIKRPRGVGSAQGSGLGGPSAPAASA